MPAIEMQNNDDLIAAHEAHLTQLYLTRAQLGIQAPPHIHTEIARIERELDRLQPKPQPMDAMMLYRLFLAETMRLDAAIGMARRDIKELREHIDRRLDNLFAALVRPAPQPQESQRTRRPNGG